MADPVSSLRGAFELRSNPGKSKHNWIASSATPPRNDGIDASRLVHDT